MNNNIKYFEIPEPKDGIKAIVIYDEDSAPNGISVKTISEIAEKEHRIPYLENKGNPPFAFYPIYPKTE
jgi:hypothetical protein